MKLNIRTTINNWIFLCFTFFVGWSGSGSAAAFEADKYFRSDPAIPWRIEADKMIYNKATDETTAYGGAILQQKDFRLSADEIRYNRSTMMGEATGNVEVSSGEDLVTGERMEVDLANSLGTFYKANLFIKKNNYHVKGEKIQKTSDNSYTAKSVKVTTCDGDSPAWSISGEHLDMTIEGYGIVKNARFLVKDMPILYTPYFIFPVKIERQTGFLMPEFGSSDRKGAEFMQPFFWAINENSDATFYEHYMSERGNKFGVEYRYRVDEKTSGTLMLDWLDDQKVDNGIGSSSKQYGYTDDNVFRPNADRYWFRMKHDQSLPLDVTARLDLDIVSDQDYLHEFLNGYNGFRDNSRYFSQFFGRDFDDYNDPVRTNRLNFNRLWSSTSLNGEFRWMDDVIARRWMARDETVQRLPNLSLNGTRQSILNLPFYMGYETGYTYFYREDGSRGHRADIHPRLYLPYRFGSYLSLEPSLGLQETVWDVGHFDALNGNGDRSFNRELYDVRFDFSSEIYRVYQTGDKAEDRIKHIMRFQAIYDYIPELNQSPFPQFDALDRIQNKDLITYSWTHSFITKSAVPPSPGEVPGAPEYNYHQFARLKFEQSYDVYKKDENLPEPFSPVFTELELEVVPMVSLKGDTGWSPYSSEFVSHNIACKLFDLRGDEFFIERRYAKDTRETIYTDMMFQVAPWLWLYGDFERNLLTNKDLAKGIGVSFQARCWSFDIHYSKEQNDNQIVFSISLFGLGDFGSSGRRPRIANYIETLRSTRDSDRWQFWGMHPGMRE